MAVDIAKLREMTGPELDRQEQELRQDIWKQEIRQSTGQIQDANIVRRAKRDLARVLTVRRENELRQEAGSGKERRR